MTARRHLVLIAAGGLAAALWLGPPAHADYSCGDQCNGQIPSYDNPDCWPGAIYCSPPGTPEDTSVTFWDGTQWVSGASQTYGQPCMIPGAPCAWATRGEK